MITFVLAFASLALILGIYAFVGLPLGGRGRRATVSAFFALVIAGLFFGYSDMLGRPKSTRLEVLRSRDKEAKVLGSYMLEGSGIYLWLLLPETGEPRYYVLPWDQQTASALQKAVEENAQHHGAGVVMQLPFERSWEKRDPVFHALPQPKLPEKGGHAPPPVQTYQAPEQRA
jgi:hypothetical protein